jgi:phospholipase/carboxylesterase
MTVDVGLRYPHRFAGLVGISGWVFEVDKLVQELSPVARQQRLLMTHGTADPLIPIEKVRPQIPLLQAAGLNVAWREFEKVHTIQGETEMVAIREFVCAGYAGK